MTPQDQARQSAGTTDAGISVGGRYAPITHAEQAVTLSGYAQMPSDWVSASGKARHTHKMAYRGEGIVVRMPSVSAIKGFAKSDTPDKPAGDAFEIPVTAELGSGEVAGTVLVLRGEDGSWATRAIGFSPTDAPYVAESVQCTLEARRPRRSLEEAGDLIRRRMQRHAQLGIPVATPEHGSSWIHGVGYDGASKTMVVTTGSKDKERAYGYLVQPEIYDLINRSPSPGGTYDQLVKGRATKVTVTRCDKCSRYTTEGVKHRCPPVAKRTQLASSVHS